MVSQTSVLKAVKNFCGFFLAIGTITFLVGAFGTASNVLIGVGIGAVMGAVFVFLMGVFFTVTQEMLNKTEQVKPVTVLKQDNIIPFVKK